MVVAETESKHMLSPLCPVNGTLSGFLAPAAYLCLIICSVSISICLAWRAVVRLDSARLDLAQHRRQVINRNQLNISYRRTRDDDGESGLWLTFLHLLLFFLFLSFSLNLWCY